MLCHLHIRNFTLVDALDLEFQRGLTAITGETGAGKSVILEALGLALGDRAEADLVSPDKKRADISATFDLSSQAEARLWLEEQDLSGEDEQQCLLRRLVTREGRSRGYINGQPVTLQQLRQFGELLIDIHSQHEHQSLLKKETQRRLLDEFAGQQQLAADVRQAFNQWYQAAEQLRQMRDNYDEFVARAQLVRYQLEELDALNLLAGEIENLEEEQKLLANAEAVRQNSWQLAQLCDGDEGENGGINDGLNKAIHLLDQTDGKTPLLKEAEELLRNALIQVGEASAAIHRHLDQFEADPQRLAEVEERLSNIYQIARKHHLQPLELADLHRNLQEEFDSLNAGPEQVDALNKEVEELAMSYRKLAQRLSKARKAAGTSLSQAVNGQLKGLAMEAASLQVALSPLPANKASAHGLEDVEFLISTNPGQSHKPLQKVASGGELSRVSLAIQVVVAQTSTIPVLVFDEVDSGIGGSTAASVGQRLRELGNRGQVICVTHLAQVASQAHQHLQVSKSLIDKRAQTQLCKLDDKQKEMEIARMLGGIEVTVNSLAHARELLQRASA